MSWLSPLTFSWAFLALALPLSIAGANIGWGLVAGSLVLNLWLGKKAPWRRHRSPLEAPLLAYVTAAVLVCGLGAGPSHNLSVVLKDLHKLWLYLLFSIGLAGLVDEGGEAVLAVLGALALGLAISASIGIAQCLWLERHGNLWSRAHAFMHPVTFGEQMAFAVLGAFCVFEFSTNPKKTQIPAAASLSLSSLALFLSQTRGAIISAAFGFAVIAFYAGSLRSRLRAAAAGIVTLAASFASDLLPTGRSFLESFTIYQGSANPQLARWTLWRVAWRMFRDHLLFGVGIGNYRDQFGRYFSGTLDGEAAVGNAHNLYLHQAAERGLVGTAALAWLLFELCRCASKRATQSPDALNLWALGATGAFLVMNITEVALQVEQLWMFFFFIWILSEQNAQRSRAGQFVQ